MAFLTGILPELFSGLGGAALGGVVGGLGNQQSQSYGVTPGPLTALGQEGQQSSSDALNNYLRQIQSAQTYNGTANADLARMLQQYAQTGGLPNQQQITAANQYAQNIFAPQQAQLNNTFNQAQINTNRQASSLGRPVNDPILQAKLAQYQGQQQGILSGQQGAFAAQTAQGLPQQQLGFQQELANQALQNQTSVFGMGQDLYNNAQNYSLGTALRSQSANSGGGLGGILSGLLGGFGKGVGIGSLLQNYKKPGADYSDIENWED